MKKLTTSPDVSHINELTTEEGKNLLGWFNDLLHKNHDVQVRFKWANKNDIGRYQAVAPISISLENILADET